MKRTRKLVTVAVLAVAVVVSAITAAYALSANTTETYAYLPEHSVYFYDTAGEYAWASSEVDTLAVAGVIKGSGTHLFYPGNAITRADFIVMLDRAYGMSEALDNGQVNSNGSFVDVPSSAYYSKAVIAAKAFGIAAGTATGEFQPQQSMTRQDAMVFLKRTIDRTALKLGTGSVSSFSDASRISNYAKPSVSALVGAKVIGGSKGKINPLSKVT
ncbi:MAG: S-layer homology domain-containing protein, partial [Butyricicoccus sp.]